MFFADSKKEENIIEYLLLMFQIETLVRANDFDVEKIDATIIRPQIQDERLANDYRMWYQSIARELEPYGKNSHQHLADIVEVQAELYYLHNSLLSIFNDVIYQKMFQEAQPIIDEFREKSAEKKMNDVDMAIQALYAKLLLKLKGQTIGEASENAIESIRKVLAYLAVSYKKMKAGNLNFINN
jgi:hypothetical protein